MLALALPGLWLGAVLFAPPDVVAEEPAAAPVQTPRSGPPVLPEPPDGAVDPVAPTPEGEPVEDPPPVADPPAGSTETPPPEPLEPAATVGPPPRTADPMVAPTLPMIEDSPLPPSTLEEREWITVRPPGWNGTGMLVGSAVFFGASLTFQFVDSIVCGDCGLGVTERIFFANSIGLAAGAGVMRGHAAAYDDVALKRPRRNARRIMITGAVLTGAGALLGLVNDGMWWACAVNGTGPYVTETNGFPRTDCRYGVSRALLDVAVASTAVGANMLTWSIVYQRDTRAYSRARVVGLRPTLGRDRLGLSVGGRF